MLKRTLIFVACGLIICGLWLTYCLTGKNPTPTATAQQRKNNQYVLVCLSKYLKKTSVKFYINTPFKIIPKKGKTITCNARTIKITAKNGICVNDRWSFKGSITLVPSKGGIFTLGKRRYDGQIIIYLKKKRLIIVNRVNIERYVAGVAAKEMGLRVSREALKAQIIAARTYALAMIKQKKGEALFHLYDDQRSQVYGGLTANWVYNLAKMTSGLVLTYKKEIFPTYYSSTCGGHTEPAWEVFSGQKRIPPFKGVKCDFCKGSKHYEWSAEFSKTGLAKKLFPKWKNPGKVIRIKFGKRLKGGHLKNIWITTQRGGKVLLDAYDKFRASLGASLIKSTLIYKVIDRDNKFLFKGRGWGHAVGMCQVGAIRMAQKGYRAQQILKHYFPEAKITSW